jgi:hypothetical protein
MLSLALLYHLDGAIYAQLSSLAARHLFFSSLMSVISDTSRTAARLTA